ncbi:MAG: 30S ribosomal protein S27ae [archaeon]
MGKKGGKGKPTGKDKKAANAGKKKTSRKLYEKYDVSGDKLVRKNSFSPKSPGDFMAEHKDRKTCGCSGYTEFKRKEAAKEEKKEE